MAPEATPDLSPEAADAPPLRPAPDDLDPLPRAEDIDPELLREWAAWAKQYETPSIKLRGASALTELSLATPDDAEAEQARERAGVIYASLVERLPHTSINWLRAHRALEHLPVMGMRRAGDSKETIAPVAHWAVIRSLDSVLSALRSADESMVSQYLGELGEDSVAGLFARTGNIPHMSSWREGSSPRRRGGQLGLSSDFNLLDEQGKVPIEVKYHTGTGESRAYDRTKVLVIRYLPDICRPLIGELFGEGSGRPVEQKVAMRLSRLMVQEGEMPLAPKDAYLLQRASELANDKLRQWRSGQ